jgi:hypothetical protein
MSFVASLKWIKEEFKKAKVWDNRCLESLYKISKCITDKPDLSFSSACGTSLRQNGSRIFSHKSMKPNDLQEGHYKETAKRASHEGVVLVVQDTTSFNYSSHKATTGLGNIGHKLNSKGIQMHTALALRQDGLPLGIIGQEQWVRKEEDKGKKHKRKSLPIESKESYKWIDGLNWTIERLTKKVKEIWLIADRESDVYEYMSCDRPKNVYLLTRACQPRIVEAEIAGQNKRCKLTELLKSLPIISTKEIELERENRTEKITVDISYSNVKIFPSQNKGKEAKPLDMTVIYVKEEVAKGNKDSIEWILLCNKQDLSVEEALQMLDFYTQRWKIERFHYTLKTGVFRVEKLQFDDAETLMNALSFYSVIAWHALWLLYYGRLEPESTAEAVIDPIEQEVLEAYTEKKLSTVKDVIMAIGKLGGFLGGSKRYPFPGIKVMWIGMITLIAMKQGWLLAKSHFLKKYAT